MFQSTTVILFSLLALQSMPCASTLEPTECVETSNIRTFIGKFHFGEYAFFQEDGSEVTYSLNLRNLPEKKKSDFYRIAKHNARSGEKFLKICLSGRISQTEKRFRRPVVIVYDYYLLD